MTYYRARNHMSENHAELMCLSDMLWDYNAYYEDEATFALRGIGPFRPELEKLTWKKRKKDIIPDFIHTGGVFTVTETLYEKFFDLVSPYVKCFPKIIDDVTYVSFRPTTFLPLLDEKRSEFRRLPTHEIGGNPRRIVLTEPPEPPLPIFGIDWYGRHKSFIFVSEAFKDIYDDNACEGLFFNPALATEAKV